MMGFSMPTSFRYKNITVWFTLTSQHWGLGRRPFVIKKPPKAYKNTLRGLLPAFSGNPFSWFFPPKLRVKSDGSLNFGPGLDSDHSSIQKEINKLDEMQLRSAIQKQHEMDDRECI